MPDTPSLFVSDRPYGEDPAFNFAPIIQTMREFISSAPMDSPFNICVSGGWGTGKTTLLAGLEKAFEMVNHSDPGHSPDEHTKYVTIWFDPWKLASEEEVRNALARAVLEAIENDVSFATRAEIGIERRNVLRMLSERLLRVNADDINTFYKADSRTRETFVEVEDIFRRVADVYLRDPEQARRLVIFVDDLDRCRPARVTEVLESVKLFFDLPGLIFVFALDTDQLERAVAIDYEMSPGKSQEYLEKIFQLTVPLPRKRTADLRGFLESNLKLIGVELQNEGLSSAIVERFGRNLRNLKLFINWFSFQRQLVGEAASLDEEALFRWLYLDSTMARSMTTSLKGGSPNLVLALEFLAHGGFMHDAETRAKFVSRLNDSRRNYTALIVYSIIGMQKNVDLPATNLDAGQLAMVEALQADGDVTETLKVMREGNELLLDSDLREMIYQARSKDIDIVDDNGAPEVPNENGTPSSKVTATKKLGSQGALDWGNPFNAQDWNQLGDKLLAVARLSDAYLCYLLATLMEPEWAAYRCDLARIFARAGHLDAAKALLAQGFEKEPTSPYVLVEVAYFYDILLVEEDLGNLLYRKALENKSTNPSTPYYLAMNLHKEKRFQDAYLACLDAYLKDRDSETKRTRLSQYAVDAGMGSAAEQRSNEDLAKELVTAIESGAYPLRLTDTEERSLWARVTDKPDDERVAAQLSRPPF